MRSYRDLNDQFRETPAERNERLRKSGERQMNRAPSPAAQTNALQAASRATDTPPPRSTDDELVEMMCEAACEAEGRRWSEVNGSIAYLGLVNAMVAALRRIRPLLEAAGMLDAATLINKIAEAKRSNAHGGLGEMFASQSAVDLDAAAERIRDLARRHAET